MTPEDFAAWLDQARQNANRLDRETYAALLKPGRETPHVFGAVEKNLFDAIVARTAPTPENAAACAPPTRVRNEEPLKAKGS
jgi:hypothetical protein